MPSRRDFIKLSALSSATTVLPTEHFFAPEAPLTEPKKNPVIILRSSWGDGNIGDQGHTPGTIRLLTQYVPNWNADEAMSVYARARTIFGMEPHSLIMGVTLGVPVIHAWPPSHGRKAWMFRDIGLPEWLFQIDESSAAGWTKQLQLIHQDYAGAKKKVAKAMAFVQQRQASTMNVINKAIQNR